MNWQPIETAPKDGTKILVYEPASEYTEGGVSLVSWDSWRISYPGCRTQWDWCLPGSHQDEQGGCETVYPTHWMPLPEPPEVQ